MVYKCSVPGCSTRGRGIKYFCAPYTNKSRWEVWLRLCPFLQKYSATQRDRIRFCIKHFLAEHINHKLKLTPSAIPVLNLTPTDEHRNPDFKLEITPTSTVSEPFIFKVAYPSKVKQPTIEQNCTSIQMDLSELPSAEKSLQFSLPASQTTHVASQKNHYGYLQKSRNSKKAKNHDHTYCKIGVAARKHIRMHTAPDKELGTENQATRLSHEDDIGSDTDRVVLPESPIAADKELSTETQATQLSHEDDIGSDPDSDVLPEPVIEEPVIPEPKYFSWEKPDEVVPVLADDFEMEPVPESLSMYCDDGEHASLLSKQLNENNKGGPVSFAPHPMFRCNVCDAAIAGFRYTCVQCSDLDLCGACEAARAHHHHYVLRVPADRLAAEVQLVLATIRRHLMGKLDPIAQHDQDRDDAISLKSEIKSEEEDNDYNNFKDNNVGDNNNDDDDDCNETNQSPEDDVLNRSTSPGLPQHGDTGGEALSIDNGDEVLWVDPNTTEIHLKLADLMEMKESRLPWVQILDLKESPCVDLRNAQPQAEVADVLSETVAADSMSRVQHASARPQIKKRCHSSELSRDTVYSYNTHRVAPECIVRLKRLPDSCMFRHLDHDHFTYMKIPTQTQASSGDSRGRSDEDNR